MDGTKSGGPLKHSKSPIHHVAIPVQKIARAIAWYQEHFNCDILYQDESWALLQFANIKLALVLPEQHPGHLAFVHEHPEQFGALKHHRDGTRSIYINDPEGNAIEFIEKTSIGR